MKKIKYFLISLLMFIPSLVAKAQLIDGGGVAEVSGEFGSSAGFTDIGIGQIVATIISAVLGLLALIFLVLTIMAGFKWMNAGGNEEQVKESQKSLRNAIMGLIIVLAAYTITYFVFKVLPFSGGGSLMPDPV